MADIPLWTGYSPSHWYKGLNLMIEKSQGNFIAEKLHIILLFEADFNSNNKWLGCLITEKTWLMVIEQYGSRKKKSAITQWLNKLLFYNIICFQHQLEALYFNDVKSCYDCIVLLVAMLCLNWLGTSNHSMFSIVSTTLHQMEHFIKHILQFHQISGKTPLWV